MFVEVLDQSAGRWSRLRTCCFDSNPKCKCCPLRTDTTGSKGRLLVDKAPRVKPQACSTAVWDESSGLEAHEKPAVDGSKDTIGPECGDQFESPTSWQAWWQRKLKPVRGVTVEGVPGAGKRQLCRSIAAHAPWLRPSATAEGGFAQPSSRTRSRETPASCPASGERGIPIEGLYEIDLRHYINHGAPVLATECLILTKGASSARNGRAEHAERGGRRFCESASPSRLSPSAALEEILARVTEEARIRRSLFRLWLLQTLRESGFKGALRPTAGSNSDANMPAPLAATGVCTAEVAGDTPSRSGRRLSKGSGGAAARSISRVWDVAAGGGCCFLVIDNLELLRASETGDSEGHSFASQAEAETRKNIAPPAAALVVETLCRFVSLWHEENLRIFMFAPLEPGSAARLNTGKRRSTAWQTEDGAASRSLSLHQLLPRELLRPGFFERRICLPDTLHDEERAAIAASEWTAGYQPADLRALVRAAAQVAFQGDVRRAVSAQVSARACVRDVFEDLHQEAAGVDLRNGRPIAKKPCHLFTLDNFRIALLGAGGSPVARIASSLQVVPHAPDPPSGKGGCVAFGVGRLGGMHRVIPLSEDQLETATLASSRAERHPAGNPRSTPQDADGAGDGHRRETALEEGNLANMAARHGDTIAASEAEESGQQGSVADSADVEPLVNRSYRLVRGFSGIIGQDALISQLRRQVIEPVLTDRLLKNAAIDTAARRAAPVGVLIAGDPGTGKSLLAAAIAHELRSTLLVVSPGELLRATLGSADKQLMRIFDIAEKAAPCVLLIEDIHLLAPATDMSSEKQTPLHVLDGDDGASEGLSTSREGTCKRLPPRGGRGACGGRLLHTLLLRLDHLRRQRQFGRQTASSVARAAGILVIGTADRGMGVDSRLLTRVE
ncbi:putative ATPase domain-containing cell division control protein [Neospora caninum Liverpool]|uniref:Putative ATPase domain-containing cell division control protein n=1 Tax=Neospora caninum (strain Liverpool) TaxID=572307 RepID=F0V936_NEOCL|nr:putative ATPase domain-containing cell division control protein [Neospora caninum Liverpool]CBZ50261.1 putative ATPase domain-containing cell division control protein [Neospora caninum Liverpool]|eukprot:XP_003880295.1 putative ATPase domain-containing cell division control protein [Neospora caninum Liverpool]